MEFRCLLFGFILFIGGTCGMQPQQYHSNFNGGIEYAEPNSHYAMHSETGYNTQNQGIEISYPYTESWFKANREMMNNDHNSIYKNFAPGVEKHMPMMNNNFEGLKMHQSGLSAGYTNHLPMANKPYIQYKTNMPSHSTGFDSSFINDYHTPHMQHSGLKVITMPQMRQHYSSSQGSSLHQHGSQENLALTALSPVIQEHSQVQTYFPQQGLHTHQTQIQSQGHISNMEHPTMHHIGSTHRQSALQEHSIPQLMNHQPMHHQQAPMHHQQAPMHHQQVPMHKYSQPQGFSAASEVSHVKFQGMGTSYAF